jgi:stringent starvation protein B
MTRVPSKKQVLLALLERGIAMVHLDARRPGVSVPAQFAAEPHLRLNLSYRFGIPDLVVDDEKVQATLSFSRQPFQCVMPWPAIFGVTSEEGRGQVWPEDLPTEVTLAAERSATQEKPRPTLTAVGGRKRRSTAASNSTATANSTSTSTAKPDATEPPKRHLRLVR